MFEARLNDGGFFKKIIDAVKDLVSDVNIQITDEGLSIQAMDSSQVALVTMYLAKAQFDKYHLT